MTDGAIVAAKVEGQAGILPVRPERSRPFSFIPWRGGELPPEVDDSTLLVLLGRITGMYRRMDHLPAAVTAIAH